MKLLVVVAALTVCTLAVVNATFFHAKPYYAVRVVPVPAIVPKINILGLVGKAVGAKVALVGKVLHAKGALVGKVLHAKKALVGHLLGSSSGPILGVVGPPQPTEVFPEPLYPSAASAARAASSRPPPPPPPVTSYGTPA